MTDERWTALSPYLDEVLELEESRRAGWLASLRERDGALADELKALLEDHRALAAQFFLERTPLLLPRRSAVQAGQTLGAYTLVAQIGEGGMGSVWLADRSDGRFERRAAVKFLSVALGARGEERFTREGQILARLTHPHIAQLLDAGVSQAGGPYFVLEHVDGQPIDRYCNERKLDVRARIALVLDVLAAIAHAHANLIVHRDIKPSNVLVTAAGEVKLLDFGIAKLLEYDAAGAMLATRDGGALTPAYAAPEQLTGGAISTATDVYAAGVLLYQLLTGEHPAATSLGSPAELVKAILEAEPRRAIGGDLGTIVGKALKKRPEDRYVSAAALADDLRRYLKHEPISARSDTVAYRTARFVRRHRWPVAAAALLVLALVSGLYAVNRARAIAERRFVQVRELANKLFDIDVQVRELPGGANARQMIVDTSLEYLARLASEVRGDRDLALELGTAYMRVARVQGIPISTNLGQLDQAEQNLRTADSWIDEVLRAEPTNRIAFFRRAQIAHDRMILAGLRRPDDQALPLARRAAEWIDRYLDSGAVHDAEAAQLLIALNNVGNRFRIEQEWDEALRLTNRGLAFARTTGNAAAQRQLGGLLIAMSRIHRDQGSLDDALREIREAAAVLEPKAPDASNTLRFALALLDQGEILGGRGVTLDRPDAAAAVLQRAFEICDRAVHGDPDDAYSRGQLSSTGRPLADLLSTTDATRALAVYDHVLLHLREISGNSRFLRDEVRALTGSALVLQRLGRRSEARQRLDAAFARLRELKLYPAEQIALGSEADDAVRGLAAYEAANGGLARAANLYQELLDRVLAADPEPQANLDEAAELSAIYESAAALHRRMASSDRASELEERRRQLWQHWNGKLPANPFILRQIEKTRID